MQFTTNDPTLKILPIGENEIELISEMANEIWPEVYNGVLEQIHIEGILERIYSKENLLNELSIGHKFWVLKRGEKNIAYLSVLKENDVLWIKKLYVSRSEQGNGIGKKLIEFAVARFMPIRETKLLVNRKNFPAQNFYSRIGFEKIGEIAVKMGEFDFIDLVFSKVA